MRRVLTLLVCLLLLMTAPAAAQDAPIQRTYQVFVERDQSGAQDRLTFVDIVSGRQIETLADGERYTPLGGAVLFFDRGAGTMRLAAPDGSVTDQLFMQMAPGARRIDWLVSADQKLLAWTVTHGTPNALTTVTTAANSDGSNARIVLQDGPRDGIRALPVAFSSDGASLYLDYQPDSLGDLTPFREYAGLFALDLTSGAVAMLPDEPGCFCGGGIGKNRFVRLTLSADLTGFDTSVYDLTSGTKTVIPAVKLAGYTQAGDVLLSPDGTLAVYALAQVSGFGTPQQSAQTVFVLVDLESGKQSPLTDPITTFVKPIGWTENNRAVLFSSPAFNGTWKIDLGDGRLNKVANAIYVGTVN